jgi:hypothetical protein
MQERSFLFFFVLRVLGHHFISSVELRAELVVKSTNHWIVEFTAETLSKFDLDLFKLAK